jgi:hypothetical protein
LLDFATQTPKTDTRFPPYRFIVGSESWARRKEGRKEESGEGRQEGRREGG